MSVFLSYGGREYIPRRLFVQCTLVLRQNCALRRYSFLESRWKAHGAHVVLNPGLPYGKDLTPSEIERLLDGSIFRPTASHTADKATQVFIGQPAIYPKELVQALVKLLAIDSSVKAAYLAQYYDPEQDQKPHLLIGIDMDGDWEKTLGDAGLVASQFLARDEFVDFVRIDESGVSRYMTDQTKPFYTRSS